jgi:TonB family protein
MYFEIEDHKPDITPFGSPLTWRDGIFLSIIVHLLAVIVILVAPDWLPEQWMRPKPKPIQVVQKSDEPTTFVFVQPKVDLKALTPPPKAPASDEDRRATTQERARTPENEQPLLRGNTRERVEQVPAEKARGQGPDPEPAPEPQPSAPSSSPVPAEDSVIARAEVAPPPTTNTPPAPSPRPLSRSGGSLGDALRNLQQYVQRDQFQNLQGGSGAFGPAIQFDTKGVEFGPWVRRFIAQVRRNWEPLIPLAAMTLKGHVVVTFNVHKDGTISDLSVVGPSSVSAFNTAAYGALASSNPTAALPPEYPSDKAFFTVTFFYNEDPP